MSPCTKHVQSYFSIILSNNVLDATKSFSIVLTDPQDVIGLPESLLQLTAEAAAADNNANLEEARLILHSCLPLQ